jgi:hypothetical protein
MVVLEKGQVQNYVDVMCDSMVSKRLCDKRKYSDACLYAPRECNACTCSLSLSLWLAC